MRRILIIGGDHPRHLYFHNKVCSGYEVAGVILEKRESFLPEPPQDCLPQDKKNFLLHFNNRSEKELKYFGEKPNLPEAPILYVNYSELSSALSVEFVKKVKPDLVLIFGCGMIREPLMSSLPALKINLHLGLSPWYKGSATLFWPFYFLEPNWAGSTFHIITDKPDAGAIIHQSRPALSVGDTIHDVGCQVVRQSAEDVLKILDVIYSSKSLKFHQQKTSGRNFLTTTFRPEHLRVIYNLYHDRLVDEFLSGKIKPADPKIVTI